MEKHQKVLDNTTSVMISNLLAGTEYQITVKAYDAEEIILRQRL